MNNIAYIQAKELEKLFSQYSEEEHKKTQYHKIKCKAILSLPLTEKERATYLLFIANNEQVKEFLRKEKELKRWKLFLNI